MPNRSSLKLSVFVIFLFFLSTLNAQENKAAGFFKGEKHFTYGLNNRRTFILGDFTSIYGVYAGLAYAEKAKHVITFSSTVFFVGEKQPDRVRMNFVGFSEEYYFLRRNKWATCTYAHVAAGKMTNNSPLIALKERKEWIFPTEWGIHTDYGIWKWLNLRTGVGYRYILNKTNLNVNGIYFKLGATIIPKHLKVN